MSRKIIKIDALPQFNKNSIESILMRRTVAYIRVSTDKDEQLNSYENQMDYYPKFIDENQNWTFTGLYSDEGLSATSTAKRDGFKQLVEDGLSGMFDLVVTKSISRFARNTVDTLNAVRKLKAAGVEVYFEKEDLFSFDGKDEFMLTLLSSLAQDESRSISENTTWGIRKQMADGKYHMPYAHFLGYKKGENTKPVIVEDEAVVVRRIFRMFLQKHSIGSIAKTLMAENIPSPAGKARWLPGTIGSILKNEKYRGSALLQKKYTPDFITKKQIENQGELPQYWVENGHSAIVSPAVFAKTQQRLAETSVMRMNMDCGFLSNMVFCDKCGARFGRKIIGNYANPNKYKHTVWRCAQTYQQSKLCRMPHLYEEVAAFVFNQTLLQLLSSHSSAISICQELLVPIIADDNRRAHIDSKLKNFTTRSPLDIPFDGDTFRTIIERAVVSSDQRICFYLINGETAEQPMPAYSKINNNFIAGSVLEKSLMLDSIELGNLN